jgi:hypothetical protein
LSWSSTGFCFLTLFADFRKQITAKGWFKV